MLAFNFVITSLAISAMAVPAPHVEEFDASPEVSFNGETFPTASWHHGGHGKWRSHSWHREHHATKSVVTSSAPCSEEANSPATSASPSPAPSSSTPSASAPAPTSAPASSSEATASSTSSSEASSASSPQAPASSASPSQAPASPASSPPSETSSSSAKTSSAGTNNQGASPPAAPAAAAVPAAAAAYLAPHNALRAKHSAKALTWSDDLAAAAKKWASKCKWGHSVGAVGPYGENIAAGTGDFSATSAVAAWASEESQYNPSNPQYSHYTQMVWKGTTQLGCAVVSCPGLINSDVAQYHVCEYNPAGNVIGQFADNVS